MSNEAEIIIDKSMEKHVIKEVTPPTISIESGPDIRRYYTIILNDHLSLRIYSNTSPHYLKTAELQKGLILIYHRKQLVEEGMGFGVPVINFSEEMFFSKSSQVFAVKEHNFIMITKSFDINAVERKKIGNRRFISNQFFYYIQELSGRIYRNHGGLRKLIWEMGFLLEKALDIGRKYVTVKSKGIVTFTYNIYSDRIHVRCDFTKLNKKNQKNIFVLNEQGSSFFRKYYDTNGLTLTNHKIGAWERINARKACFSDLEDGFCFCLSKVKNSALYRGREVMEDETAWSGLIYKLTPNIDFFNYIIRINDLGGKKNQ